MSCQAEKVAFEAKMQNVQEALQSELKQIEIDTERKAKQIEEDFEANHDLAEGVGATLGTVVGGLVGGAPGGATGAIIGKTIGSLFVIEIGMRRQKFALDVPQVRCSHSGCQRQGYHL